MLGAACFHFLQEGTRYDGQIAVFGSAFQEKLERQKYFLVRGGLLFVQQGAHSAFECSSICIFLRSCLVLMISQTGNGCASGGISCPDPSVCSNWWTVPNAFPVSFDSVIFTAVFWLYLHYRQRVYSRVSISTVKKTHTVSENQILCNCDK